MTPTPNDLERATVLAGWITNEGPSYGDIIDAIALALAAQRERDATLCEGAYMPGDPEESEWRRACRNCAATIRTGTGGHDDPAH